MKLHELTRLARIGAESEIAAKEAEIANLRAFIGGKPKVAANGALTKPRNMSAAARRRISVAAKRRWIAWRKEHGK